RLSNGFRIEVPEEQYRSELETLFADIAAAEPHKEADPREAELAGTERELEKIIRGVSPENLPLFDGRLSELRQKRDRLRAGLARTRLEAVPAPAAPAPVDLESAIETTLAARRRFVESIKGRDDPDILTLRNELLPSVVRKMSAHPEQGY